MSGFPNHNPDRLFSSATDSVAVLGTVHHHRMRWNPFATDNALQRFETGRTWLRWFTLYPSGGRHGDGIYTIRFVINHNPRRPLKLANWKFTENQKPDSVGASSELRANLWEDALGRKGENLSFRVHRICSVCILVDPDKQEAIIRADMDNALSPVKTETSFELNGFVWDELDSFAKFEEHRLGRAFRKISNNHWQISVPLRCNGGIDFRSDGVYQFLISRNGDEDQGLAAINSAEADRSLELVSGSGFGSSHGTCLHSAATIKVEQDGMHVFDLFRNERTYQLSVHDPNSKSVAFCNHQANSIQLLGTVFKDNSFDPTQLQAQMNADAGGQRFYSELHLDAGTYSINFAIGKELFLDTMGLGCWLQQDGPGLRGIGWHGKPNEANIVFHVHRSGQYGFHYDRETDEFGIDPLTVSAPYSAKPLEAVAGITSLSLVGNFAEPLESWQPESPANLMCDLGGMRYEKLVRLDAGETYQFKFVANRTNWLLVFADYEFDGFGMQYDPPMNPQPFDSQLSTLKRFGHLTTHGNPPAMTYQAQESGLHRFAVDLNTGAYAISPILR